MSDLLCHMAMGGAWQRPHPVVQEFKVQSLHARTRVPERRQLSCFVFGTVHGCVVIVVLPTTKGTQKCTSFITQTFWSQFVSKCFLGVTWQELIKGIYKVLLVESSTGSEFIIRINCNKPHLAPFQALPSLVPRPSLYGRGKKEEGSKGLVNNSPQLQIHKISLMFNN